MRRPVALHCVWIGVLVCAATLAAPAWAGVTFGRKGDALSGFAIDSGAGKVAVNQKIWGNTYLATAKGKALSATDPFFYSSVVNLDKGGRAGGYWGDRADFDSRAFEIVKDPKRPKVDILRIGAVKPKAGLRKEVALALEPGAQVVYVWSRLSALRKVNLKHDRQGIYLSNIDNLKVRADDKDVTKNAGFNRYVAAWNTKGGWTLALVLLPRDRQSYPGSKRGWLGTVSFHRQAKSSGVDVSWQKGTGAMAPGATRTQQYAVMWGDGDLRDEAAKLSKRAQAGELNGKVHVPDKPMKAKGLEAIPEKLIHKIAAAPRRGAAAVTVTLPDAVPPPTKVTTLDFRSQPKTAVLEARCGPYPYEAWNMMRYEGKPAELGLWLDKERYDTLDVSGGGYVFLAPEVASKQASVLIRVYPSKRGAALREARLPAHLGCVSLDVNLKGLAPGEYRLVGTLQHKGKALAERTWAFRVVAADRPTPKRERIRIRVRNPAGRRACRQPAYVGAVLPKGALASLDRARIVDAKGRELPAQLRVQSRWDRHGSAQWVGAWQTLDHTEGADHADVFLEYGASVRRAAARDGLRTEKTTTGWRVTNGPLQAHLATNQGNPLQKVFFDANGDGRFAPDELAWDGSGEGVYLTAEGGARYLASGDKKPRVTVEADGPECFALRTESWYVGDKKPACYPDPGLCKHITRVRLQRGVPRVDVDHTWLNTARSWEARYTDIALAGRVPNARWSVFGREDGPFARHVGPGSKFWLTQDRWNHYGVWSAYTTPGHHIPGEAERLRSRVVAEGAHAPGWGAMVNDRVGVAIGCEDFWQNYPCEISALGDRLAFHMWPAHGVDHDREVIEADLDKLYWLHEARALSFLLPGEVINFPARSWHTAKYFLHNAGSADAIGVSKTHALRLCFFPASKAHAAMAEDMAAALRPTVASPEPASVVKTGVLGLVGVRDVKRFPRLEPQIENIYKTEIRLQELARDYGKFIFGDRHSGFNLNERRFNIYRGWRSTHHNAPRTPWLLYLRSGDPFYFLHGKRNAMRCMDMGLCHHSRPETEKLPWGPGKKRGALCDYKGLVPWHSGSRNPDYNSMTDYALYYTYLTGNERGRGAMDVWWEGTRRFAVPPGSSRSNSGTQTALIALYQDSWDRRMIPMIHTCYRHQLRGQNAKWGYFNEWQNYAPWIERYWTFTGSEDAKRVLLKWADAFLRGWGDQSCKWGCGINVPAYAYVASGDPKYARFLNAELWEESRSSLWAPGAPVDGMGRPSTSLAHYYMQRALNAMEAVRRSGVTDGWRKSGWAIHPARDGKRKGEVWFYVLDEDDKPMRLFVFANLPERPFDILALGPDRKVAWKTAITPKQLMVHGGRRASPWGYLTLPPDGKKGVYEIIIRDPKRSIRWAVVAPFRVSGKEVYPTRDPARFGWRAGRGCFTLPRNTGKYVIDIEWLKGGCYPCELYDGQWRRLAIGTRDQRSDGVIKWGDFPITVDSAKTNRLALFVNRGCAANFSVKGKRPPKYVSVTWDRYFDPEAEGFKP